MFGLVIFFISGLILLFVSLDVRDNTSAIHVMRRMGVLQDAASDLDKFLERMFPRSYRTQLQDEMDLLGMQANVFPYVKKRLMNGLLACTICSYASVLTGNVLLVLAGMMLGWAVFNAPIRKIRRKAHALRFEVDKELTYLMTNISQLVLSGMAAYQAVIQAAEAVPETDALKPYARKLVSDLRLGTDVGDAFMRLGMELKNAHAQRFGVVLKQLHLASGELSMEILMKQYSIAEKAKREMFQKAVKLLPNQLKWPNLVMFANFVILPVLVVGYTIVNILMTVF